MAGRAPMDLFQEAVRATVMRWTALNLAVSYEFGDGHSENHRREELIQQTVAGFASAHAANKRWESAPRTRPGLRAVRFFSPGGACPPADTRRTFRLPPRGGRPACDARCRWYTGRRTPPSSRISWTPTCRTT